MGKEIEVGDTVRLKPGSGHRCPEGRDNHATAKVQALMGGVYAGGLMLERDLCGCRYWNKNDVQKVAA